MSFTVAQVCREFGRSRQAFYKYQGRLAVQTEREQQIVDRVNEIRKDQPMLGTRKLQHKINSQDKTGHGSVGRDRLYTILRRRNLLIRPSKSYIKTTNSYHRFRVYKNLIKDIDLTAPDQVYVADITYIMTLEGFCYLSLLTDLYSRKIVGYCLSKDLGITGCLTALKMALKGVKHPETLIHHSDRGIQYCSTAYVKLLNDNHIRISMTGENHVYENAVAERVNGILKHEFMLGERLVSFDVAKKLVAESIKIYNNERPHLSLNYRTPNDVYTETTKRYDSGRDRLKVIHTESTSYPHKSRTYQHISDLLNMLKLKNFFR